jgi:hypothetical protein
VPSQRSTRRKYKVSLRNRVFASNLEMCHLAAWRHVTRMAPAHAERFDNTAPSMSDFGLDESNAVFGNADYLAEI